jgi:hypothetical protein
LAQRFNKIHSDINKIFIGYIFGKNFPSFSESQKCMVVALKDKIVNKNL